MVGLRENIDHGRQVAWKWVKEHPFWSFLLFLKLLIVLFAFGIFGATVIILLYLFSGYCLIYLVPFKFMPKIHLFWKKVFHLE